MNRPKNFSAGHALADAPLAHGPTATNAGCAVRPDRRTHQFELVLPRRPTNEILAERALQRGLTRESRDAIRKLSARNDRALATRQKKETAADCRATAQSSGNGEESR